MPQIPALPVSPHKNAAATAFAQFVTATMIIIVGGGVLIWWNGIGAAVPYVLWLHGVSGAIALTALIWFTVRTQTESAELQREFLATLPPAVRATQCWATADSYLVRRASDVRDVFKSTASMFFIFVVWLLWLSTYFTAHWLLGVQGTPVDGLYFVSFVLGGPFAAPNGTYPTADALHLYQAQTALVGVMAFITAYIYILHRMVVRLNNNDMAPMSFHLMTLHLLSACLLAGVLRHALWLLATLDLLPLMTPEDTIYLAGLVAVLVGIQPRLWLDSLVTGLQAGVRRLASLIEPPAIQSRPRAELLPESLPTSLLVGAEAEIVDRMAELDICNLQRLALENPLVLWLRTAHNLPQVVDFIGQAYLGFKMRSERLKKCSDAGVQDVFAFMNLAAGNAKEAERITGIAEPILAAMLANIREEPAFRALSELRAAMLAPQVPASLVPRAA